MYDYYGHRLARSGRADARCVDTKTSFGRLETRQVAQEIGFRAKKLDLDKIYLNNGIIKKEEKNGRRENFVTSTFSRPVAMCTRLSESPGR